MPATPPSAGPDGPPLAAAPAGAPLTGAPAAVPGDAPVGRPAAAERPAPTERPGGALRSPGVLTRTWREQGYLWLALLLAPFTFAYAVLTVALSAGLAVTVVGLFVGAWLVVGGRMWGGLFRAMGRAMLHVDVPAPLPLRREGGFWRSLGRKWGDAAGWRAIAFGVIVLPLSIVSVVLTTTTLAVGLGGLTHWIWSRWLPATQAADGTWHRGAQLGNGYFVDTPVRQLLLVAVGAVMLLAWQKVTVGMAHVFRLLTVNLLGPTQGSLRVAHLEQARGTAVVDADARLRRIERDLHDGTQARLVAVAMQVGDARERLVSAASGGADPLEAAQALAQLDDAHGALKETLSELREIARGIHPPALDGGLAIALETLAARSSVPVTVDLDLPREPAPEVQTIAYFAVAELLTNVARHSGASGAYVRAENDGQELRVRVRDDGRGGAGRRLPGASGGTGLQGLADRVAAVDGALDIDSPVGGPTVVTVHLPLSVAR